MPKPARGASTKRKSVKPDPTPPISLVSAALLEEIHQDALEAMWEIAGEYGAEDLPARLLERAKAILGATCVDGAKLLHKRVLDATLVHVLVLWARNKIPGKMSEVSVARRIKQALNLADMLEGRQLPERAASQRERAVRIQAEWNQYKAEQAHEQRQA